VAARTLDEGVAWAQTTLGVKPGPGGTHPLFGTHNRLIRLDGEGRRYLEIMAIDPAATPTRTAPLKRWFDLDDPDLQARLSEHGPQLVHWVARVHDIDAARHALLAQGMDRGPVLQAARPTPSGELRWHITVRDDGQRLCGGALPTLIQWGDTHPADAMPASGLSLHTLALSHRDPATLQAMLEAVGISGVPVHHSGPALRASLHTPLGPVEMISA
jgi:hypothetical protein